MSEDNQYWTLLNLATEMKPVRASTNPAWEDIASLRVEKVTHTIMQLPLHNHWAHPSNTKMERNV